MQSYGSGTHANGTVPFLALPSLRYSLTDGTPIPPPLAEELTPSATSEKTLAPKASLRGPLSSHPVTPIEEPASEILFPNPYSSPNPSTTTTTTNGDTRPMPGATPNGTSLHAPHDSDDSNNFDPALPPYQPSRDTSRRPSLVERLMPRLRSSSFLRSRSRSPLGRFGDSSTSLARQQPPPGSSSGRGTKRPAPADTDADPERPQSRASTFPRLVRKKSIELLSTARRRSGMWSRDGSAGAAVDEERRRERAMEAAEQEAHENQRRVQAIREQLDRRPPPRLPEMRGLSGGSVGGEELFSDIGR